MPGEWSKAWRRELDAEHPFFQIAGTKERAADLAKLNLPPGTEFLLLPLEGQWAWIFLSPGCEMCCTPVAKGRQRIYSVAGARSVSDRRLEKITRACETAAEDDETT